MNIKDKVKSKNKEGSFQGEGVVLAIYDAEFYNEIQTPERKADLEGWNERFPDWKEKTVVVVKFDEHKKSATLKEWVRTAQLKGVHPDDATASYETSCPTINVTVIPIDDLEVVRFQWVKPDDNNSLMQIFSIIDDFANEEDFESINHILGNVDVQNTDTDSLIAYLMATAPIKNEPTKAAELLTTRSKLYDEVRTKLTQELGEEETADILDRLK